MQSLCHWKLVCDAITHFMFEISNFNSRWFHIDGQESVVRLGYIVHCLQNLKYYVTYTIRDLYDAIP